MAFGAPLLAAGVLVAGDTHGGSGVDAQAASSVVAVRQTLAAERCQGRWHQSVSLTGGVKRFVIGGILMGQGSNCCAMVPGASRAAMPAAVQALIPKTRPGSQGRDDLASLPVRTMRRG